MADTVSRQVRTAMMSGIKSKNTKPEMLIRLGLHARGFRYKLHDPSLPGRPDLVFPKYRAIILVNGCFWHMHECALFKLPATRTEFWREKLESNQARDSKNIHRYLALGWRVMVIWECALKGRRRIETKVVLNRCASWLVSDVQLLSLEGEDGDSIRAQKRRTNET